MESGYLILSKSNPRLHDITYVLIYTKIWIHKWNKLVLAIIPDFDAFH